MSSNNDIAINILNLTNRVSVLENEIKSMKETFSSQNTIETKSKKSTGVKTEKPNGYPKDPTPVHHRFAMLLKETGETDVIRKTLEPKYSNDKKGLESAVKKEVSRLFAVEKGHKQFDENGKPTDIVKDDSLYTKRVKDIFDDFHKQKEISKKQKEQFDQTEEGKKYKDSKSQKEKGTKKEGTKKEAKKDTKPQTTQIPLDFADLGDNL